MRSRPAARELKAALLLFAICLATAGPLAARSEDSTREPSNLSVVGIDELESPTHRETFGMLQYTPDPIVRFNRGSLKVSKPVIHWVMRPIAKGWRFITPEGLRESLDNFFFHLAYPSRLISLLLQGEIRESGEETAHFLVNTTLGVLGFFDMAAQVGVPTHRQDFGLAFARWGSGPGFYLFIPLAGPSSGRDGLGRLFDTLLHPLTYLPGAQLFFNMNAFTSRIEGWEALVQAYPDPYFPIRALWSIQREIAVERFEIPQADFARSDPEPSLGVLLFRVQDPGFPGRVVQYQVHSPTTDRRIPYSAWIQDDPAPLVFIIPGIGAHRGSSSPVALAEMVYREGFSAAIVSSPFHPEFLLNGLSAPYPGYTPSDAEDLYAVISEIHSDIEARSPGQVTSTRLLGYSLGGIATLFVAAAQPMRPEGALRFERFVAINPPVDLRFAASQFDTYFDAPLRWDPAERELRIKELAMKAFLFAQGGVEQDRPPPFDRTESEFLIGFMGRTMMADALTAIRVRGGGSIRLTEEEARRTGALLAAINASSMRRYADDVAVPYYLKKLGGTPADLRRRGDLRSQESRLRADGRIRILTNADDFILGPESLAWLQEVMGSRLTVFPSGGHLGNLHRPEVQDAVLDALGPA